MRVYAVPFQPVPGPSWPGIVGQHPSPSVAHVLGDRLEIKGCKLDVELDVQHVFWLPVLISQPSRYPATGAGHDLQHPVLAAATAGTRPAVALYLGHSGKQ